MDTHLKRKLPIAVFRKPKESQLTAVFQFGEDLFRTADFQEKGFVFAPFHSEENAVLIKPDELHKVQVPSILPTQKGELKINDIDKEVHINLVKKGIEEISTGNLKKVILSRRVDYSSSKKPVEVLQKLLANYPNAYCYLFYHPKVGMWCGATPETLVHIKNGNLSTMSLAATLPYTANTKPEWGPKEIEEQKMVSDYIREKLEHTVANFEIGKTESVRAGNLWHLKSEVKGNLPANADIKKIIMALHPTPAVCGIPTQKAKEFIKKNEGYDRSFYTGFLGEINLNSPGEISLFVNLRCMELSEGTASIYVGGGITAESNPESEWIEIQNKSLTMLNIL
ncbi:isochorismate synthase [Flagellimonas nanhaiensis]|uniref:isochorismate synthase n=1 Tax=Flagellimonas nanhaiensis TaxID=2292706 RepID=A0A371JWA8_9FLAO|nr:isochorismate synthase [Allomuricauda nanhaiensis]